MYECCIGIKIILLHWSTMTTQPWPTTADAGGNAPERPTRGIAPHAIVFAWWAMTPRARGYNLFRGWGGVCPSSTLRCYGDASSSLPEQRSTLRAIHPPLSPLARGIVAHQSDASCGALWGHFRRRRPWLWRCFILPEHEPLFPVEPRHSGYRQKALVSSKTILALCRGGDVEIKEKRR